MAWYQISSNTPDRQSDRQTDSRVEALKEVEAPQLVEALTWFISARVTTPRGVATRAEAPECKPLYRVLPVPGLGPAAQDRGGRGPTRR